jgi:hypothetical protein
VNDEPGQADDQEDCRQKREQRGIGQAACRQSPTRGIVSGENRPETDHGSPPGDALQDRANKGRRLHDRTGVSPTNPRTGPPADLTLSPSVGPPRDREPPLAAHSVGRRA